MARRVVSAVALLAAASCGAPPPPVAALPPLDVASPAGPHASAHAAASAAPAPTYASIGGDLPETLSLRRLRNNADASNTNCTPEVAPGRFTFPEGSPVAIWDQSLSRGGCVAIPKDDAIDVAFIQVSGEATVEGLPTSPVTVKEPWTIVWARGGGVTLRARKTGPYERAIVVVSTVAGRPIACAGGGRRCRPNDTTPAAPWTTRKLPADVFSMTSRPDLAWGGGAFHARVGWDTTRGPLPGHVVDALLFAPGVSVPPHEHDKQWECMIPLEGTGELVQKMGAGDQTTRVAPGDVACIPAGRRHAFKGSSSRFLGLQVYAPPGPERRFVKLADAPSP